MEVFHEDPWSDGWWYDVCGAGPPPQFEGPDLPVPGPVDQKQWWTVWQGQSSCGTAGFCGGEIWFSRKDSRLWHLIKTVYRLMFYYWMTYLQQWWFSLYTIYVFVVYIQIILIFFTSYWSSEWDKMIYYMHYIVY